MLCYNVGNNNDYHEDIITVARAIPSDTADVRVERKRGNYRYTSNTFFFYYYYYNAYTIYYAGDVPTQTISSSAGVAVAREVRQCIIDIRTFVGVGCVG